VGIRHRLTHRAVRQVNTTASTNDYGQPDAPSWSTTGSAVPCFFFVKGKRQAVEEHRVVYIEDLRMHVALEPGWTSDSWSESDRVLSVQDRLGASLASGPFEVEAIERHFDHYEIVLNRVAGQLAGT
jgi:hypothetical protein